MNNPWLGLSSYTEEALKEYKFYGRTTAIATLTALIRSNLFVTLYGRSGIGKTSLLQAGVFPQLRKSGFSPVAIRLNTVTDGTVPAAKILWDTLTEKLKAIGYLYKQYDSSDLYNPDFHDPMVFRYLFGAGRFVNSENKTTSPVMVLDQFEEILYNAPKASRLLITQLYALIDDNYNLQISHPSWHEETNFRIVVSIREDDLFLFEDWIDTLNYADLKSNRYRLLPLTELEAREIILEPLKSASGIFDKEHQEEIADKIIDLARTSSQNINTLMLSLLCYVLYEDSIAKKKPITLSDLESYDNIIETYYMEVIKDLPINQRYYLEDHLLDEEGRRTYIYKEDLNKFAPEAEKFIRNTNQRLFNENQGRVEFIHDQLASAVSKIRTSRKKVRRNVIRPYVLLCSLILLLLFFLSLQPRTGGDKTMMNYRYIAGNDKVESVVCDSSDISVADCPFLKNVKMKDRTGSVFVNNCPNLVKIEVPDSFEASVRYFNCPNLEKKEFIKPSYLLSIDSLHRSEEYMFRYIDSCNVTYFYEIKQYEKKFIVKNIPIALSKGKLWMSYAMSKTGIPDSVKRELDCYVPLGCKNKLSNFAMFQAFKSMKELSLIETIKYAVEYKFIAMLSFFKWSKLWRVLAITPLIALQLFFWFISYGWINSIAKFKKWGRKSKMIVFTLSFINGIGMSVFCMVSFMAFYWLTYNWLAPWNQPLSTIIGVVGAISCLLLVYYKSFKLDKLWSNVKYRVLKHQ